MVYIFGNHYIDTQIISPLGSRYMHTYLNTDSLVGYMYIYIYTYLWIKIYTHIDIDANADADTNMDRDTDGNLDTRYRSSYMIELGMLDTGLNIHIDIRFLFI